MMEMLKNEATDKNSAATVKNHFNNLKDIAKSFNRDETGLKVVEMLLIIFVAAIILIGFLKVFFPNVLQKVSDKVNELLGMSAGG